jgi:transcriptional regulator with XRE-family HTH domain
MFLRKYRKATRYTATELANKLGVTVHGYRRWERGEVEPRASQLGELSIILECSIDDLVFDKPSDDEANRITIRIKPGALALIEVLAEEEKINSPYKTNLKLRNNKPETAKKRKTG